VTLVVGLVCRLPKKGTPAVIVAGDKQPPSPTDGSGHRIAVLPGSSVLVAGVGPPSLTGQAIDALHELLPRPLAKNEAALSCEGFDVLLRETITPRMRRIVLANENAVRESGFGLILACSDREDARLYAFQSDEVPFRVDRGPGYGCLARGRAPAGGLRFSQFRTEDLPPKRAGRLAAFMILATGMVDARVGRDPEIFETVDGTARSWNGDALALAKERVRAWDESLSRFRGWLSPGETDFGVSAMDSLLDRRPVGVPPEIARDKAEKRNMAAYLQQPT